MWCSVGLDVYKRQGVNRSTFYLHYEGMNDLLLESIKYAVSQMKDSFKEECRIDRKQIEECPLEELKLVTPQYLCLLYTSRCV